MKPLPSAARVRKIFTFDRDDSWRYEIEEFYDCIIGKKDKPLGNSARMPLKLCNW